MQILCKINPYCAKVESHITLKEFRMKSFLSKLAIVAAVAVLFSACGDNKQEEATQTTEPTETVAPEAAPEATQTTEPTETVAPEATSAEVPAPEAAPEATQQHKQQNLLKQLHLKLHLLKQNNLPAFKPLLASGLFSYSKCVIVYI